MGISPVIRGRRFARRPSPEVLHQHELISLAGLPGVQEKLPVGRYAGGIADRLFDGYDMVVRAGSRPEKLDARLGRGPCRVQHAREVINGVAFQLHEPWISSTWASSPPATGILHKLRQLSSFAK